MGVLIETFAKEEKEQKSHLWILTANVTMLAQNLNVEKNPREKIAQLEKQSRKTFAFCVWNEEAKKLFRRLNINFRLFALTIANATENLAWIKKTLDVLKLEK